MLKIKNAAFAAAFVMGFSGAANASAVLDQSYTAVGGYYVNNNSAGQSFTAGVSGQLASVGLQTTSAFTSQNANFGTTLVSIYNGNSTSVADRLGTASLATILSGTDITVDVSSLNVSVTAGQQYTFTFYVGGGAAYLYAVDGGNPYAGGNWVLYNDPNSYADGDTGFKTFVGSTSAVPEPASWAMMLLGFGAIGAALRSRRSIRTERSII